MLSLLAASVPAAPVAFDLPLVENENHTLAYRSMPATSIPGLRTLLILRLHRRLHRYDVHKIKQMTEKDAASHRGQPPTRLPASVF